LLLAEKFGIMALERAWGSGVEVGHHFFLFCALGRGLMRIISLLVEILQLVTIHPPSKLQNSNLT
jgi:hypothetical protein